MFSRVKFCYSGNADINLLNFIPGSSSYNSILSQPKDPLEGSNCFCCRRSIDSIYGHSWNQWIIIGNGIKLFLNLQHGIPRRSKCQYISRPGCRNPCHLFSLIDIHRVSVIIPKYLNCGISLISQCFGTPLTHPLGTGHSAAITILGQNRLFHIRPGQIIFKNLIYNLGNTFKDISSIDPLVIKCSGRRNRKIKAFISVRRSHRSFVVISPIFIINVLN